MQEKTMAIIGLGNQAKAWALNLKDSGWSVTVFLRPNSKSLKLADQLGFKNQILSANLKDYQNLALLIPDHEHQHFLQQYGQFIQDNTSIIYAHGHSLSRHQLQKKYPQFHHLLLAPKAIASELRFHYQTKQGVGAVYSVEFAPQEEQVEYKNLLFKLAQDLGITCGPYSCSVGQETDADLFSEQALLCGLLPYAALAVYQTLRSHNIPKEAAYFECWHECKLICQTLMQQGPVKFFEMISPNALLGAKKGSELLVENSFKEKLHQLMSDVKQGQFDQWVNNLDVDEVKNEILDFWKKEELSALHDQLYPYLYQGTP